MKIDMKSLALVIVLIFPNMVYGCIASLGKSDKQRDLLAIGQASYSIYYKTKDDEELKQYVDYFNLKIGETTNIDEQTARKLFKMIDFPTKKYGGGGAANTAAGIAALGGNASFIGIIAKDRAGYNFRDEMSHIGVDTNNILIKSSDYDTSIVFSLISPDGERTMLNYPGVSHDLKDEDIDWNIIKDYKIVFAEGYMWGNEDLQALIYKAFRTAHQHDVITAFNLGSVEMSKQYRESFLNLLKYVDILFANQHEISALFKMDIKSIIKILPNNVRIAVLTMGPEGAIVVTKDKIRYIEPAAVKNVVDTTGAGDMMAAGFLYGCILGLDSIQSAHLGSKLAAEIIQQIGSKPENELLDLIDQFTTSPSLLIIPF